MFEIKENDSRFESLEEFVDNIKRGGEIEFTFENNEYSITHPNGRLCYIKVGDEDSITFFSNIDELLEFEIRSKKIKDIATKIEPYFRCF